MPESTVSFPAIFFGALIGTIVFIALSQLLLDPHEQSGRPSTKERGTLHRVAQLTRAVLMPSRVSSSQAAPAFVSCSAPQCGH
jgi:hypothetical protein